LPWFNAYRFLVQNISRYEQSTGKNFVFDSKLKNTLGPDANFMDRWIISANQNLIKYVRYEMDNYKLYNVVKPLLQFLEELTNWYVRLNRPRMKGDEGIEQQQKSLNILFEVLLSTTTLMSCITPFLTETMYQNLRNGIDPKDRDLYQKSVHFL
jgi:isoleucyl-tRNA synthetase